MNNGVGGGGCVGEEMRTGGACGGWRSLVGAAVEFNDEKIRERGGASILMAAVHFKYTTIK
jgi:hypothetical protein